MSDSCSLSEYARRRGVTRQAVTMAVNAGRLKQCIAHDPKTGRRIVDVDLADKEWDANTDYTRAPGAAKANGGPPTDVDAGVFNMQQEAAREKYYRAKIAEHEYKKLVEGYVPIAEVEQAYVEEITASKARVLGVPAKARQVMPELSAAQIEKIDDLIREALESTARSGEDPEGDA